MSHFSGHFEGASTFLTQGSKSLDPLKMSLEMAHKVIVPQKKIMSRSFLNSGTLIVIIQEMGLSRDQVLNITVYHYDIDILYGRQKSIVQSKLAQYVQGCEYE
jgi:hypothetical protein